MLDFAKALSYALVRQRWRGGRPAGGVTGGTFISFGSLGEVFHELQEFAGNWFPGRGV